MRYIPRFITAIPFFLKLAGVMAACLQPSFAVENASPPSAAAASSLSRRPMMFEANQGQFEPGIDFIARGPGYTFGVQPGTMYLSLRRADDEKSVVTQCRIVGASQAARGQAEKPLPTLMSYFLGNDPAKWRSGVPTCAQVRYPQVYPGVDLVYYGNQRELEYDFIVAPGASPDQIRLEFPQPVTIDPVTGEIVLALPGGELRHRAPVAYQETAGRRQPVSCTYFLSGDRTIGFRPEAYDPALPLTIDPILSYSSYFGDLNNEAATASYTDISGKTYICGTTDGDDMFETSHLSNAYNNGTHDAFILEIDANGLPVYGTLIGSNGDDVPTAIAKDSQGNIFVAGVTTSNLGQTSGQGSTFPHAGKKGYDIVQNGTDDVFVVGINPQFQSLIYSTYLGGPGDDFATGIAVNSTGKIWVCGGTASTTWTFNDLGQDPPPLWLDHTLGGGSPATDGFVARLDPNAATGQGLEYFTYLGGSGTDECRGIALDSSGSAWITGYTLSDDFPKVAPLQINRAGAYDAFVTKLDSSGMSILYSSYLGGSGSDYGFRIALDPSNQIYVAGQTRSANFPVTANCAQSQFGGGGIDPGSGETVADVFVAQMNPDATEMEYATYLGGNDEDRPRAMVVNGNRQAQIVGSTKSPNFPQRLPTDNSLGGDMDAFFTKVAADGGRFLLSTYIGGSANDEAVGLGFVPNSVVRIVGWTDSTDYVTTPGANSNSPGTDLFILGYGLDNLDPLPPVIYNPDDEDFIQEPSNSPVAFDGYASDQYNLVSGIADVEIFIKRSSDNRYWNGTAFASTFPIDLGASYSTGSYTWASDGTLPLPIANVGGLTLDTYTFTAVSYDKSGNSNQTSHTVYVDTVSPRVAITSPTHNSWVKTPVVIIGTAGAASDAVLQPERVTLTIFREGQWWDGDSWVNTNTQVHANVNNGTWAYPGNSTDPVAIAPTGDGEYGIVASVTDSLGRTSRHIASGKPKNNNVIFRVDATPPLCTVLAPIVGASFTSPPVRKSDFAGTAYDSSGQPTVKIYIKRESDEQYWNGLKWVGSESQGAIFGAYFPLISTNWSLSRDPPRLGRSMKNGSYTLKVVASDPAGNETTVTRPFTVNWNPVWLRPQDELAKLQPAQVAPIGDGSINAAIPFTYDPHRDANDTRPYQPMAFGSDPSGGVYVISGIGDNNPTPHGVVIQKLGPGGWRHEHILIDGIEGWGDGGTENFVGEAGSTVLYRYPTAFYGAVDSAGNTYVAFASGFQGNAPNRVTAIKWDPSGQRVWRTVSNTTTAGFIHKIQPYQDGSLLVVRGIWGTFSGIGGYTPVMLMADRVTAGGFGSILVRGTLAGDAIEPVLPTFLFAETDPLNNTLIATYDYQVGGEYPVYRLHRINSSNVLAPAGPLEVDPGETPESWKGIKADAEGNVYILSSFDLSDTDRRLCLTRYDASLNQVWRAFGPPRSMPSDSTFIAYPPVMHIGPWGITIAHGAASDGYYTEFPNEHGQITRFSAAGDMLWSRAAASGNGPLNGGETIPLMEVDTNGSVLFLATFHGPNATRLTGYGKFSGIGDLQFLRTYGEFSPFNATHSSLLQGTHMLALVNNSEVVQFTNPDNVLIPVLLDADKPEDTFVVAGSPARLDLINRGSLSIYQWRKENLSGTPVNISGATLDFLKIPTAALSDSGQYSVRAQNLVDSQTSRTATLTVLPAVNLAEALDTPGRTWTTGGHVPWAGFAPSGPVPSHDGVDAAMPGKIGTGQNSWIETSVTGPGSLSFWWKTSSFYGRDHAEFSVDGQIEAQLSGEQQGWNAVTIQFGEGEHTLRWAYYKLSRLLGDPASAGMDRMWLDEVVIATPVSLEVALDDPGRTWTTTGDATWTGTTAPSHDGLHSAHSGPIDDSQETSLETTVVGPGTASFWWKTSCDSVGDVAEFRVGNSLRANLNGESAWTYVSTPVPAGSHTLRWTYVKDFIFSKGQDRIWVDEFFFESDGPQPPVVSTLAADTITAAGAVLRGTVNPKTLQTTVFFEYGTAPDALTSTTSSLVFNPGANVHVPVSRTLTGLLPETTYYFRIKATNSEGTSLGDVLSFTTPVQGFPDIVVESPANTSLTDGVSTVDFGTAGVNDVTVRSFTIKNAGNAPLASISASFGGANSGDFSLVTLPSSVVAADPGAFTTFIVQFRPAAAGGRSGILHIASNDADENTFDIALTGTATAPPSGSEIVVEQPQFNSRNSNSTVDFGSVARGGTVTLSFVVRNVGSASLTGIVPSLVGGHAAEFKIVTKPAASLTPGTPGTLVVSFTPKAEGARATQLKITSNDSNENPFLLQLTGACTPPVKPDFTLSPTSQVIALGAAATLHSSATGDPEPAYQWRKGTAPVASAKAKDYLIPAAALTHAGTYTVLATNSAGNDTSNPAEIGVVDTASKTHIVPSGGTLSLTCNAAGNAPGYRWKWNGSYLTASSHYVDVTKKTLVIKGLNSADNGSFTCEFTCAAGVRDGGSNLVAVFEGPPDITPLATGDFLPPGIVSRLYSYQVPYDLAVAKVPTKFAATGLPPGMTIHATTGLISGIPTAARTGAGGTLLSYSVKITASNSKSKDEVTVNLFIAPLPAGAVGVFEGPIVRNSTLNSNLGGRVDLKVESTGSFTCKMTLGTTAESFVGTLASDSAGLMPQGTATLVRKGKTTLTISFTINTASHRIDVGDLSDGTNHAAFTAWRNVWTPASKPGAWDGYYTTAWDLPPGNPTAPQGTTFGAFTVSPANGTLTLGLKTADMTLSSQKAFVGPQGQVLIYQLLYTPVKGSLAGTMQIAAGTDALNDADNTLGGTVTWSRPANSPATTTTYKDGFGPVTLDVGGGRYIPPSLVLGLTAGPDNARLVFSEAGIGAPPSAPDIVLGIGAANAITYPAAAGNPRSTTLKLVPATGSFTGSFLQAGTTPPRKIIFEGIIIPDGTEQRGYGTFLLPQPPTGSVTNTLSGQVIFEKAPSN